MKDFDELNISDDFLFGAVMRHPENSKGFLEALFQKKIDKIEMSDIQKNFNPAFDSRGIRLDVYIKDEQGTIYDVEMQTVNKNALEKRVRYYQSCIDVSQLQRGGDYVNLKDSYVIFIMTNDYFKEGLAMYNAKIVMGENPQILYNDGRHIIYLNSAYKKNNAPNDICKFLDYVECERNHTKIDFSNFPLYIQEIDKTVKVEKADSTTRRDYMTLQLRLRDEREEGIAEGKEEKAIETAKKLMALGVVTLEQIAACTGLSLEKIKSLSTD